MSSSSRRSVSAAVIARRASSAWARGGSPKAPERVTPLLSTSTFAAPSKRAITRWKACTPRCASSMPPSALSAMARLAMTTVTRRISCIHSVPAVVWR